MAGSPIASLFVQIGADTTDLVKGLSQAENAVTSTAGKFANMANLTQSGYLNAAAVQKRFYGGTQDVQEGFTGVGRTALRTFSIVGSEVSKSNAQLGGAVDAVGQLGQAFMFGQGAGLAIAAVGIGITALVGALNTATSETTAFKKAIDELSATDQAAAGLAQLSGATVKQARVALEAAKVNRDYALALKEIGDSANQPKNEIEKLGDTAGQAMRLLYASGVAGLELAKITLAGGDVEKDRTRITELFTLALVGKTKAMVDDYNAAIKAAPGIVEQARLTDIWKKAIVGVADEQKALKTTLDGLYTNHIVSLKSMAYDESEAFRKSGIQRLQIESDTAESILKIRANLNSQIIDIQSNTVKRIADIELANTQRLSEDYYQYAKTIDELNRAIVQSAEASAQDRAKIESDFLKSIADITASALKDRESAGKDYAASIEQITKDSVRDNVKAEEDFAKTILSISKDRAKAESNLAKSVAKDRIDAEKDYVRAVAAINSSQQQDLGDSEEERQAALEEVRKKYGDLGLDKNKVYTEAELLTRKGFLGKQAQDAAAAINAEYDRKAAKIKRENDERLAAAAQAKADRLQAIAEQEAEQKAAIAERAAERAAEAAERKAERLQEITDRKAEMLAEAAQRKQERLETIADQERERLAQAAQQKAERLAEHAQRDKEQQAEFEFRRQQANEQYQHTKDLAAQQLQDQIAKAMAAAEDQIAQARRSADAQVAAANDTAAKQQKAVQDALAEMERSINHRRDIENEAYGDNVQKARDASAEKIRLLTDERTEQQKLIDAIYASEPAMQPYINKILESTALVDALGIKWERLNQLSDAIYPGLGEGGGGSSGFGSYASGGLVPGYLGQPQLAVVHGGEMVTPPVGRGTGSTTISIVFNGVSAPTNAAQANESARLLVTALRAHGVAV